MTMVSLERFNKENHRYIHFISRHNGMNCGYRVWGCIGTRLYMMYSLSQVVKSYKKKKKRILFQKRY